MTSVLLLGVLAVHELRYLVSYGPDAGQTLAHHGHGYLSLVMPAVALLAALSFGHLLVGNAVVRPAGSASTVRWRRLWPLASLGIFSIYASQELLEGLTAAGHPAGWAAVFGGSGWTALPLAGALGALVASALRLVRRLESRPARTGLVVWPSWIVPRLLAPHERRSPSPSAPVLGRHLAGRAPPGFFVVT